MEYDEWCVVSVRDGWCAALGVVWGALLWFMEYDVRCVMGDGWCVVCGM